MLRLDKCSFCTQAIIDSHPVFKSLKKLQGIVLKRMCVLQNYSILEA